MADALKHISKIKRNTSVNLYKLVPKIFVYPSTKNIKPIYDKGQEK